VAFVVAPAGAYAHPVPALAPDFGAPECITVVDKRTSPTVQLDYFNGYDDVMEEPDHIPVPDQKTHQFFALRGMVTAQEPEFFLSAFDPTLEPVNKLPLWINQADLLACEAKNLPTIAPDFSPANIGMDTLTERPDMAGMWMDVRMMRVPITERQALLGLSWTLADVPAGVYQVAGYIYSPPYNAWEGRPGVIKVIDGTRDVPAVTMSSVDAMLFQGQGRKVTGCVNAAAGSTLQAYARPAGSPGTPWEMWASQPVDDTGKFELCYRSPTPGFAGIMDLRVVAVGPDGEQTAAYPPDQIVLISNSATCTPSAKFCCDATAPADGSMGTTSVDPAAPGTGTMAQPATADMMAAAAGAPAGAAASSSEPAAAMQEPESSGCSSVGGSGASALSALGVLLAAAGLRRRRRTR
jgi:uncharacterized protein (TIGR03382 family)